MNDAELNKFIHEKVMGDCVHNNLKSSSTYRNLYTCECRSAVYKALNEFAIPDYCHDLNAAARAEAKAIEAHRETRYLDALSNVVANGNGPYTELTRCAIANARQRCEALYRLYTENL